MKSNKIPHITKHRLYLVIFGSRELLYYIELHSLYICRRYL